MYGVYRHGYGRKVVQRGPMEGCLNWPEHTHALLTPRPVGLKRAKAIADAEPSHAQVVYWMASEVVYDNGKPPAIPQGWWPPDARTTQDPRPL